MRRNRKHDASNNLEEVDQATGRISANQLTQVVYDHKSDSISTAATNHTEENIEDKKEENVDKGKCGSNKEEDNSASITKCGSKKDKNSSARISATPTNHTKHDIEQEKKLKKTGDASSWHKLGEDIHGQSKLKASTSKNIGVNEGKIAPSNYATEEEKMRASISKNSGANGMWELSRNSERTSGDTEVAKSKIYNLLKTLMKGKHRTEVTQDKQLQQFLKNVMEKDTAEEATQGGFPTDVEDVKNNTKKDTELVEEAIHRNCNTKGSATNVDLEEDVVDEDNRTNSMSQEDALVENLAHRNHVEKEEEENVNRSTNKTKKVQLKSAAGKNKRQTGQMKMRSHKSTKSVPDNEVKEGKKNADAKEVDDNKEGKKWKHPHLLLQIMV